MRTVGSYEAKTHLPRLLDEVAETREEITITKNGKPVARLVPADDLEERRRRAKEASDKWVKYRDEHNIRMPPGESVVDLVHQGRREQEEKLWRVLDAHREQNRLNKQDG